MKLNNNMTMKNANICEHTKQETLTYKINNLHTASHKHSDRTNIYLVSSSLMKSLISKMNSVSQSS